MFKSELDKWYDSLPKHTQERLSKQPIWHTEDLFKFFAMGLFIGFMVGLLF